MSRVIFALCVLCLGCGETAERPVAISMSPDDRPWLENVEAPPPQWVSATGLFEELERLTPATEVTVYEPPHVLWSNAAEKLRFLYLPEGTFIDTQAEAGWRFPVGTVLAKTFTMSRIEDRRGAVAIETRLMFRRAAGWEYAVYHWNAEGTEARLEEGNWGEIELRLSDTSGNELPYLIPGRLDCRGCHETQVGDPVIGIHPLNLDPNLLGAETFDADPRPAPLPTESRIEARAMSYFLGNCAFCHHGGNRGNDNASFSLLPGALIENTVNVDTASSASGIGIRVVPGAPEASALYEAVVMTQRPGYEGDFKAMPPIGVVRMDPDVAEIIAEWINAL
jgi:hypothetical protein